MSIAMHSPHKFFYLKPCFGTWLAREGVSKEKSWKFSMLLNEQFETWGMYKYQVQGLLQKVADTVTYGKNTVYMYFKGWVMFYLMTIN